MTRIFKITLTVVAALITSQSMAQVVLYERQNFRGQTFTATRNVADFNRVGFNDRASSVVVLGERWEVCSDSRFRGDCMVLRPGRYPSLAAMGMSDQVSSVRAVSRQRQVEEARYAPPAESVYDSRPRRSERMFEAPVTSVRAVVNTPEKRCWMEREEIAQAPKETNVGGALAGALIGGILGHQVGGGAGKDLATVGGAVAGAALGAQVGRDSNAAPSTRAVQRCTTPPNYAKPEFWDVSYTFRGVAHRVQLAYEPGDTITVNARGEPRT